MGFGDECDKPGCINRKIIIDALVNLFYGEERRPYRSSFRFALPPERETVTSVSGSHEQIEATVINISKPLVDLIVQDLDGNFDLEKITKIKFQNQKVAIDLERLETLLRQSGFSPEQHQELAQEITDDFQREIKKLLSLILKD